MAEVFNEFDPASPAPVSHCRKMSSVEFELEGAQETQNELEKLIAYLEKNPEMAYGMIRKKKKDQLGVASCLKVKMMTAIQGDEYLKGYFPDEMCEEQLTKLKCDLISAFDYGQEAKGSGRRMSSRLAEKRRNLNMAPPVPPPAPPPPGVAPPVPPPAPPPPPPSMSQREDGNNIENLPPTSRLSVKPSTPDSPNHACQARVQDTSLAARNNNLLQSFTSVRGRRPLRVSASDLQPSPEIQASPIAVTKPLQQSKFKTMKKTLSKKLSKPNLQKALQDEIVNARMKLRCINSQGTPSMTPYQKSRQRREDESSPDDYPMFNVALVQKFRNARSPSCSPSGYFSDSSYFDSPS